MNLVYSTQKNIIIRQIGEDPNQIQNGMEMDCIWEEVIDTAINGLFIGDGFISSILVCINKGDWWLQQHKSSVTGGMWFLFDGTESNR